MAMQVIYKQPGLLSKVAETYLKSMAIGEVANQLDNVALRDATKATEKAAGLATKDNIAGVSSLIPQATKVFDLNKTDPAKASELWNKSGFSSQFDNRGFGGVTLDNFGAVAPQMQQYMTDWSSQYDKFVNQDPNNQIANNTWVHVPFWKKQIY